MKWPFAPLSLAKQAQNTQYFQNPSESLAHEHVVFAHAAYHKGEMFAEGASEEKVEHYMPFGDEKQRFCGATHR